MRDRAVDLRVAPPAPLVVEAARVAEVGSDEAVPDPLAPAPRCSASQVIEPIVPGMNRKRYE